jgi:hypothetical protein
LGFHLSERRLAARAVQHTGSSRERLTARGQRRAGSGPLRLDVLERRAARQLFRPSAFAELPTRRPSRARLAGWGQQQPIAIRPLAASLPSSCRISSRWRAAGTLSTRGSHQPGALPLGIARQQCVRAARQPCRAANADGPAGRPRDAAAIANERARGRRRAAWPLAQVARRALSDGRGGQGYSTLAPPVHHHITHESQLSALRGV